MKLDGLRVILTGGRGRLGKQLTNILWDEGCSLAYPTSEQWDITTTKLPPILDYWVPDIIIHCAAYTDVPGAENNKADAVRVNVLGTENVVSLAKDMGCRLVHISSDYVGYHPMGFYATTKMMAEALVPETETIIRTSFKDRGTWGENALTGVFHPVYTNADWTDVIAKKIVEVIKSDLRGVVNVGTKEKTLKDLAMQEYADVAEIPVEKADGMVGYHYPRDCRMKLTI